MSELNWIYLSHPALWEEDYDRNGFSWLDCHQEEKCVYIMKRRCGEETLIAFFNFSAQEQTASLEAGHTKASILLNTDWEKYGGSTPEQQILVPLKKGVITLDLPPFSGILISQKASLARQ